MKEKNYAKLGKKKGRPAYRTPSSFIIKKTVHPTRAPRLKGKVHKLRTKKKK